MQKYEKIAKKLIEMAKKDQEMRKIWAESGFKPEKYRPEIDRVNEKKIREIVKEVGWPTISTVGKDASTAAWLLVQHAGENPSFQKTILQKMKRLPKKRSGANANCKT